jgi:5-methylcytosine-specific restriction endonuclease McrA
MPSKTSPERLAYLAEYRSKNKERLYEYQKNWAKNNRDKERAKSARYTSRNKEWNALKSQKRRARMADVIVYKISDKDVKTLYAKSCSFCGTKENITLDHIIPISRGGSHGVGNLQPLCLYCNSSKKDKTIMEWRVAK